MARVINPAKWDERDYTGNAGIRADALTGDLRTHDDTVSLWECDHNPTANAEERRKSAEGVVLAVAANWEQTNKTSLLLFDERTLTESGFELQATLGDTNAVPLRNTHRDLIRLDMEKLCRFARLCAERVRTSADLLIYTKADVRRILRAAIDRGDLREVDVAEKLRAELRQ